MKSEKSHILVLLIAQNPIQTILRFQVFQFFLENFFYCFDPYTAQVKKMKSAKNNI